MQVILPDRSTRRLDCGPLRIEDILHQFGINPVTVIVTRNGKLVPETARAGGEDEIRIIAVAHGG